MANNEAVAYKDYVIYPLALYLPGEDKWQPMALMTRDTSAEDLTLPRSQSVTDMPGKFDTEDAALGFAVEYARGLIDRNQPGLTI